MFKSLTSNPRRQQFFNLLIFFASYLWFKSFSNSVLSPYFLSEGFSIAQMQTSNIIFFSAAALLILLMKSIKVKQSWRLALITSIIFLLLISNIKSTLQFYLSFAVVGLSMAFFYIPYNISHFELTPKHRTSFSSAILFSLSPLIGILAPLLAGLLASFDYSYIWIFSFIFFSFSFFLTSYQPDFNIKYQISFKEIKPTFILIILQSFWEIIAFGIIPIFSLYFIKSPLYFGAYLSYLSIISVIANLSLGKFVDKLQKRAIFLFPLTLILSVTTFLFPLALKNIVLWLIFTGIIQFFIPIFWNLTSTIFVDTSKNLRTAFITRELVLSVGRAISFTLLVINFSFQTKPTYIFYFLGFIMLLFPIVLFYQNKINKRYNYL